MDDAADVDGDALDLRAGDGLHAGGHCRLHVLCHVHDAVAVADHNAALDGKGVILRDQDLQPLAPILFIGKVCDADAGLDAQRSLR